MLIQCDICRYVYMGVDGLSSGGRCEVALIAYGEHMRWDDLFADLQAQFDAAVSDQVPFEVTELAEAEIAGTTLADRWRARQGAALQVRLRDGSDREGVVTDATPEWVVLARGRRRILIPRQAVVLAQPLGPSAPESTTVERALGLGHVLRALAQERMEVVVHTVAGAYRGRLARVGGDHCDLAGDGGMVTISWQHLVSVESGT